MMKKFFLILFIFTFSPLFAQEILKPELHDLTPDIHHNPWELIIYRPENTRGMNDVRCWLKIEDMDGNDVTFSAVKASYEWISIPDVVNQYKKSYYLSGGMAMHLQIKSGRYNISFYTPSDKQWPNPSENKNQWESNKFLYDTENPAKVIFVYPAANENGFYSGEWIISGRAPKYWESTIPLMK